MSAPEIETFPLAYVVEKTGVPSVRWLKIRLRSGEIRGRLAGREWRMTHSDIADLVEHLANKPKVKRSVTALKTPAPTPPDSTVLTAASRRRRERRTH